MTTLSKDFMKKVAELYKNNRMKLENFEAQKMEKFANKILELIKKEKSSPAHFMTCRFLNTTWAN